VFSSAPDWNHPCVVSTKAKPCMVGERVNLTQPLFARQETKSVFPQRRPFGSTWDRQDRNADAFHLGDSEHNSPHS
jgi:hypothetical protein